MNIIEKVIALIISFLFLSYLSFMAVQAAASGTDYINCFIIILCCLIVWGITFAWMLGSRTEA